VGGEWEGSGREVGGEWLDPVLWAQNVFPACLEDANGAHEPIRIVFFQKFGGEKLFAKIFVQFRHRRKRHWLSKLLMIRV